jgi:hypothetical protein
MKATKGTMLSVIAAIAVLTLSSFTPAETEKCKVSEDGIYCSVKKVSADGSHGVIASCWFCNCAKLAAAVK